MVRVNLSSCLLVEQVVCVGRFFLRWGLKEDGVMRQSVSVLLFVSVVGIVAVVGGTAWAGLETADPLLPPTGGEYRSPSEYGPQFVGADLEILLQNIVYTALAPVNREDDGPNEREIFNSTLTGIANVTYNGLPPVAVPFTFTGPSTWVAYNKVGNPTGTFDVEIVEMQLEGAVDVPGLGLVPIILQESPTEQSTGETTISDLGGGLYHIDSFFDVFAEASPDGGASWIAAQDCVRIELVPEPATLGLLVMGGLAMLRCRRK